MQASTHRSGPSGSLPPAPRRSAIAYAVWLAVGSAALTLAAPRPALAQAAAQQAPGMRLSHDIPAGPLAPALRGLAGAANMLLTFTAEQTNGKTTAGIRGQYTPEEALAALLADSGLQAVKLDNGGYVLRPAPAPVPAAGSSAASEAALPTVRVAAMADAHDGTTEHTGSYTTRASTTATKLSLSPRETPQTLTVVTRQKMDDFSLTNIDNVLESSSAISILKQGQDGATYYSRGFTLQSQYDGMPNPIGIGGGNRGTVLDTAFLDKVEILQGASGLLSGAGEPGGTINLVRKRPTEQFQSHIEVQVGSWKKKRIVGDISGSLIDSGKIRGRMVALVDRGDSFTDYVYDNRQGFYGIVETDISETTTLSANVIYQRNDFNMHYGVPMGPDGADLGFARSRFFGLANGGDTKESTSYTLNIEQKLPDEWLLKVAYARNDMADDYTVNNLSGKLDPITGSGLRLSNRLQQRELKSDVFDAYASGPFLLFGRKHEIALGFSSSDIQERNRLADLVLSPIDNIYDYDGSSIPRPAGTFGEWPTENKTVQKGIYGATRLNISDSVKFILGTRVSWYEYKKAGVQQQKEDAVISPYFGLIYDVGRNTSIYASYSDIFKPQSNLKFSGGTVDPIVGKNYEIGFKSEILQRRLNASVAVFRLEQTNLAKIDQNASLNACDGGRCYTAAGLVVSQGIDLGLNGEIGKGWKIGAGYTYVHREYGNGDNKGKAYGTYMPKQIFRVYATYLIPGTNWVIGGNIRAQSRMYLEDTGLLMQQGRYAIMGLIANYQISKQAQIGVAVNNIFDRRYYESIGSYNPKVENFYGAPRSFTASLKYNF